MSQFDLYILEAFGLLVAFVSPRALGGAEGDRTPDLDIANVALSQLSYGPAPESADNVETAARLSRNG